MQLPFTSVRLVNSATATLRLVSSAYPHLAAGVFRFVTALTPARE